MQIGVITNPNSRKNKGRTHRVETLQSIVGNAGEVHQTRDVDSIKPILRDFLRKRARYWVADGGDGALHWMVRHGLEVLQEEEFASTGAILPTTLPTNGGTIDFVANNVGIKGDAEELLRSLRRSVESGDAVDEVEVDSMMIDAVAVNGHSEEEFRTYGFAVTACGIGQRICSKYYEDDDPNPRTLVKIIANAVASVPSWVSPVSIPGMPQKLTQYGRDMFGATPARVTLDGELLAYEQFTGINIGSMSINVGNVLRFFNKADELGVMHAIVGDIRPLALVRNLRRMHLGREIRAKDVVDRACHEMIVEATGDELLAPIIDGEEYPNLRKLRFRIGPRVRIPKVVSGGKQRN
jgi:hypothetical protein